MTVVGDVPFRYAARRLGIESDPSQRAFSYGEADSEVGDWAGVSGAESFGTSKGLVADLRSENLQVNPKRPFAQCIISSDDVLKLAL